MLVNVKLLRSKTTVFQRMGLSRRSISRLNHKNDRMKYLSLAMTRFHSTVPQSLSSSVPVHLSIWCDSPESVSAGIGLFSKLFPGSSLLNTNGEVEETNSSSHRRHEKKFARLQLDSNTLVDLVSPSFISFKRRMLFRKHGGARLVEVSIGRRASSNRHNQSSSSLMEEEKEVMDRVSRLISDSKLIYQDSPRFSPLLTLNHQHATSSFSKNNKNAISNEDMLRRPKQNDGIYLKEIVIGVGEDQDTFAETLESLSQSAEEISPFLYRINEQSFLRVLPSLYSAMVFSVPNLEAERERSVLDKTFLGRIGATSSHEGQFHMTSPDPLLLRGLDVRLCGNRGIPAPMFAESNEATFEGSVVMNASHGDVSCRGMTALEGVHRVKKVWSNLGFAK